MKKRRLKSSTQVKKARKSNWLSLFGIAGAVSLVILAVVVLVSPAPEDPLYSNEAYLRAAEQALVAEDFERALKFASLIQEDSPHVNRSYLISGEACTRLQRLEEAIGFYEKVTGADQEVYLLAQYALAELHRVQGRWEPAYRAYLRVLEGHPNQPESLERVAFLLGICGQRWESVPHLMNLVSAGRWDLQTLAVLTDVERPIEQYELVQQAFRAEPKDRMVRLAVASHAFLEGDMQKARTVLEEIIRDYPAWTPPHAMLGEVLFQQNALEDLAWWNSDLPAEAENSPTIWYVRGQAARAMERLDSSAEFYARAIALAPEYRQATYQLGQVLAKLQDENYSVLLADANLQAQISQDLDRILASEGRAKDSLQIVSEGCFSLGRYSEARAWALTSQSLHGPQDWASEIVRKIEQGNFVQAARTQPSFLSQRNFVTARASQASGESFQELLLLSSDQKDLASTDDLPRIAFSLEDSVGIDFTYVNGADPETRGARMFEQTGGGVGVIDYDNDGWPDLYFTQGGMWKTGDQAPTVSPQYTDRLYRNQEGSRFLDVTDSAGIEMMDFGQGLAVGDVNSDGFDDIYVCNVGENRLWLNNGDGTFSQAESPFDQVFEDWTTSAVIADINGNGLSDLYEVNYVQGEGVYTLICNGRGCSPSVFQGTPNRGWLNDGTGNFTLIQQSDGKQSDSKSLGIVAMRLQDEAKTAIFVSNDQVPNFLMVPNAIDGAFGLEDQALLRGVALNADGLSMGCMGIAVDDLDGNGTLDLLITNFSNESNSLYSQDRTGLFSDMSLGFGIHQPSYPMVGWGAQFLDADLDGYPDLVIANGNVDDYRDVGGEYQMLPQFFRNLGGNRLELMTSPEIGNFFTQKFSGRGLARLDWNRDGRMDFVVSNIDSLASLVTNQTSPVGNFLNVRLVGVQSERHPVGAKLILSSDEQKFFKHVTAGDGYQACNEKLIQFGLGQVQSLVELQVEWPSGLVTSYSNPPCNQEILCVEGDSRFYEREMPQRTE